MVLFRKRERILHIYAISKVSNMIELNEHAKSILFIKKKKKTILNIMTTVYKICEFIIAKHFFMHQVKNSI